MNLDQIRDRDDRDRLRSHQGALSWNQVMEDRAVLLREVERLTVELERHRSYSVPLNRPASI